VVASKLIDTMVATLDANGRATEATVPAVLAEVRQLAEGVRGARALI